MSDDDKIPWAQARDSLSLEELERAAGEGRIRWTDPERDAGCAVDEAAAWGMMRDALNTLERLGVLLGPVDIPSGPEAWSGTPTPGRGSCGRGRGSG